MFVVLLNTPAKQICSVQIQFPNCCYNQFLLNCICFLTTNLRTVAEWPDVPVSSCVLVNKLSELSTSSTADPIASVSKMYYYNLPVSAHSRVDYFFWFKLMSNVLVIFSHVVIANFQLLTAIYSNFWIRPLLNVTLGCHLRMSPSASLIILNILFCIFLFKEWMSTVMACGKNGWVPYGQKGVDGRSQWRTGTRET